MDFDNLGLEKRSVPFAEVDITGNLFDGYAAIYGQEADLGDFTEEVARGAFRKPLAAKPNVPMYWDHDARIPPLATTRSGTLRLTEDARGLRVQADLDDDHYMTPTLRSMIRRGDVSGMSFGFVAGQGNSKLENRGGKPHRVLTNFAAILDVSPTWEPAYAGTSAELRSALATLRMAEGLDPSQQVLSGAYQQLGDGATIDESDTDEQVATCETCGTDPCSCEAVIVDEEQRSGVTAYDKRAAAARRRRLQMMSIGLPEEFRADS